MSAKAVKKYTSALLIIGILWGFIGFSFGQRYGKLDWPAALLCAFIAIVIVVQIERQIILTIGKNRGGVVFRCIIGCVMAVIGSVIIDQVIFKDDVEKRQLDLNQNLIDTLLPKRTAELNKQITETNDQINIKEAELSKLVNEINTRPIISLRSSTNIYGKDSLGSAIPTGRTVSTTNIPNPKQEFVDPLRSQIISMINRRSELQNRLVNVHTEVQRAVESKVGFLDELNVLFTLLLESKVAFSIWILWFIFLFALELFVLVSKVSDKKDDYLRTVEHQMAVRIEMLGKLRGMPDETIIREDI
jgi:hypothetical protein